VAPAEPDGGDKRTSGQLRSWEGFDWDVEYSKYVRTNYVTVTVTAGKRWKSFDVFACCSLGGRVLASHLAG
jgi:hypothetical protein